MDKKIHFFKTQALLRKWFEENHKKESELLVGFYKVGSGKPSITWEQLVDEELCYGWIDGVRKSIDEQSWYIRITPRRDGSVWSAINIKKIEKLKQAGLMKPAGLAAFAKLEAKNSKLYSYENNPLTLTDDFLKLFKANKKAWTNFQQMAPYYQKVTVKWVMSAKQETTKLKRLTELISDSEAGRKIKPMASLTKKPNTKNILSIIPVLLWALVSVNCGSSLQNLETAKLNVQNYYEGGQYDKETDLIIGKAINNINEIKTGGKEAIIFDVDETALSSYEFIKSMGFGYVHQLWSSWLISAQSKAVPQTKRLYNAAIEKGIHVIFLTGREDNYYECTYKNLVSEGYAKFDTLITRKPNEHKAAAAAYKSGKRSEIASRGYKIVMNVGDQQSDLDGGNSGIEVKLPDYLYLIP